MEGDPSTKHSGLFITFEGGDGSGKGTQTAATRKWLLREGYDVTLESFPRYHLPSAQPIIQFLNGEFGEIHPDAASALFSLDRLHAAPDIYRALSRAGRSIFLADRFTNSNLGHNGSKLDSTEERLAFFERQRTYEYQDLGIPKPDHTIIFQVTPELAQENVDKKAARSYTDKKRDIHEADANHLARTYDTYNLLAETYPDEFTIINPMNLSGDKMRSVDTIQAEVRRVIRPLLELAFSK